jgi:hypothetical protein
MVESQGVRSALVEKLTFTTLKMMPMSEAVAVQNIAAHLDPDRNIVPYAHHSSSGLSLPNELHKWALALKTMRQQNACRSMSGRTYPVMNMKFSAGS